MPLYEYQCEACGQHSEVIQKMSDPALTTCPNCNKDALKKLISAAAFHLKGTGWYVTDFKNKPSAQKTEDAGKSSETKTEVPAPKKEEKKGE